MLVFRYNTWTIHVWVGGKGVLRYPVKKMNQEYNAKLSISHRFISEQSHPFFEEFMPVDKRIQGRNNE